MHFSNVFHTDITMALTSLGDRNFHHLHNLVISLTCDPPLVEISLSARDWCFGKSSVISVLLILYSCNKISETRYFISNRNLCLTVLKAIEDLRHTHTNSLGGAGLVCASQEVSWAMFNQPVVIRTKERKSTPLRSLYLGANPIHEGSNLVTYLLQVVA